jgi:hypothetical protein
MKFLNQEDRMKAQGTDLLLVHLLELLDRKGLWRFHGFSMCIKDMVAEHNHKRDRLFWREKYWSFLATASVIEPLDHVFWE